MLLQVLERWWKKGEKRRKTWFIFDLKYREFKGVKACKIHPNTLLLLAHTNRWSLNVADKQKATEQILVALDICLTLTHNYSFPPRRVIGFESTKSLHAVASLFTYHLFNLLTYHKQLQGTRQDDGAQTLSRDNVWGLEDGGLFKVKNPLNLTH